MRTREDAAATETILDKRNLHALGVLLPVRFAAISFFAGRHALGRAGEGMRFLRTRAFEPGQDNPRDIDKFSPPGKFRVNEWEAETQASIMLYADVSASMQFPPKAALANLTLLQLTYSLWRASDRVRTTLFSAAGSELIARRNLNGQLEESMTALGKGEMASRVDPLSVLSDHARQRQRVRDDLIFMVSDFCSTEADTAGAVIAGWRNVLRKLPCDLVPAIISFELDPSELGSIRLWDAEQQRHRMTLLTRGRIAAINARERERVHGLQQLFRCLGLDHLLLRHAHDVYPELIKLARWRRRRCA